MRVRLQASSKVPPRSRRGDQSGGIDDESGANPFTQHHFLQLLEASACATPDTGWTPCHVLLREQGILQGAAPAYLKTHSRGEFVFDQAWAQAYQQHGLDYYPKLVVSVPFTWPAAKAQQLRAAGSSELGEVTLDLKP